jgi:hypothetical protein
MLLTKLGMYAAPETFRGARPWPVCMLFGALVEVLPKDRLQVNPVGAARAFGQMPFKLKLVAGLKLAIQIGVQEAFQFGTTDYARNFSGPYRHASTSELSPEPRYPVFIR